ncbi:MAG: DUF4118 domain-containing protein [Peptoniphilus sp.]|nr:DUF4118 domain-containing protein [Peptoniphilus sp.]MDD7363450.1 DUF4118 domain-containing protein [Bacillota bacterium]MDY6044846.1 DUF4118 domain-containing protein [Peptoniphilus sp.]
MHSKNPLQSLGIVFVLLVVSTGIGYLFRSLGVDEINVVILYILVVLLVAWSTEAVIYGFLAAILSLAAFNWFFTEPYFTLKVDDPTYLITFITMTLTTLITTTLTANVKKANEASKEREAEAKALYEMTTRLTDAKTIEEIGGIAAKTVHTLLGARVAWIPFDDKALPARTFLQVKENGEVIYRELRDRKAFARQLRQINTPLLTWEGCCHFPVASDDALFAVIRIDEETAMRMTPLQRRMFHAMIENSTLALEHFVSIRDKIESREETERERYRANLLRSISHDLRTPLSAIMGTSEVIMSMSERDDARYKLSEDIYEDAQWLFSLVENILNLTKLQDGVIALDKKLEDVYDVIGVSLSVIEKRMPDRTIEVSVPDELLLVPMDESLISQVLVNLLDNAIKHTDPDKDILLCVNRSDDGRFVEFHVLDRGVGIPEENLEKIFQMFFTTRKESAGYKKGIGIGLAICKTIIEAHGGVIYAQNRLGGGSALTFTLPLEVSHEQS